MNLSLIPNMFVEKCDICGEKYTVNEKDVLERMNISTMKWSPSRGGYDGWAAFNNICPRCNDHISVVICGLMAGK